MHPLLPPDASLTQLCGCACPQGEAITHCDSHLVDDGSNEKARRTGTSWSSKGKGASVGAMALAQKSKGDKSVPNCSVTQQLLHGQTWTMPPKLRNKNKHHLEHGREHCARGPITHQPHVHLCTHTHLLSHMLMSACSQTMCLGG